MNELLTPEETAQEIKRLIGLLQTEGRRDLLLKAIGVPLLEELRIEAARRKLSRLVITRDYRFVLEDYHREVDLQPVHKAVYLLFLAHPEGIEFKRLVDYREELLRYYMATAKMMDKEKVIEGHQREVFAYQEGVYGHHGRIFGELLYHQRTCAAADGGFGPYLVQAPEGDHAPKGAGGQGVRGKVVKF